MCSIIYLVCYVKVWNLNKRRGGVVKIGGGMLSFGGSECVIEIDSQ